jgi:hypothetical protein
LNVAGLGLEFRSREDQPLLLLRTASSSPPGFLATKDCTPSLTVELQLTGALSYRASSKGVASAELSADGDLMAEHLSAICRAAMSQALSQEGGALIHAAAAIVDGRAILLVAPSEGGKTTLSGLLASAGAPILSDETIALRPLVGGGGERFNAYGTFFWSGPTLPTVPGGWPLQAVAFLEKGPLGAEPLPQAEALGRFLREWHVASDTESVSRALRIATKILESAPAHRLSFGLDDPPDRLIGLLRSWAPS